MCHTNECTNHPHNALRCHCRLPPSIRNAIDHSYRDVVKLWNSIWTCVREIRVWSFHRWEVCPRVYEVIVNKDLTLSVTDTPGIPVIVLISENAGVPEMARAKYEK